MTIHPGRMIALAAIAAFAVAAPARADIVTDWNQTALRTVLDNPPSGLAALRNLAIVQLAVHDAVNAAKPKYEPYLYKPLTPLAALPEAAALSAAFNVLATLYPAQRPALETAYRRDAAKLPDGDTTQSGLKLGQEVATFLVESRAGDGSNVAGAYVQGADPLAWRPTPPAFAPAAQPAFAKVKPFFLKDALQFDPGPPAPPASRPSEYDEAKRLGARGSTERTADQTAAAIFWTAPTAMIFTSVARQVSDARKLDLHDNARLFALLHGATVDGYIAGWAIKYKYPLARPVTLIREADKLGIPGLAADPDWEPVLNTPPHPDYVSAHSIFAGASVNVLQAVFGGDAIPTASVTYPAGAVTRRYDAFSKIAQENDNARVWGGIHTRLTVVTGGEQGRKIGEYAVSNFLLKAGRT